MKAVLIALLQLTGIAFLGLVLLILAWFWLYFIVIIIGEILDKWSGS